MLKLDNAVLLSYINNFYGYGNLSADLWFIGMEEGVDKPDKPFDEINRRITQWHLRGESTVEDLADYHHAIDVGHFFSKGAKLQRTWLGLMKIMHAFRGTDASNSQLLNYQMNQLARQSGQECILELFPLPSQSLKKWPYGSITSLDQLASRRKYTEWIHKVRIEKIQNMIEAHKPKIVIFYGSSYERYWLKIAEPSHAFEECFTPLYPKMPKSKKYYSNLNDIHYYIIPHPVARNLKNEVFIAIGQSLRAAR